MSVDLRVDWCDHKAAEYAVMHWHYSETMPNSKVVKFGIWEDNAFVGVVLYGAPANNHLGEPYGLTQFQVCELVRVALTKHKSAVSQIVALTIKRLKESQPGLRLLVSFADPEQDHHGGIYQAMNWLYAGKTSSSDEYIVNGKRWHGRALRHKKPGNLTTREFAKRLDPNAQTIKGSSKHRYLYPLDRAMRKQIAPLAKPYPKRETCEQSVEGDTVGDQPTEEGSIPSVRSDYSSTGDK